VIPADSMGMALAPSLLPYVASHVSDANDANCPKNVEPESVYSSTPSTGVLRVLFRVLAHYDEQSELRMFDSMDSITNLKNSS
jgi:hypothetical protein